MLVSCIDAEFVTSLAGICFLLTFRWIIGYKILSKSLCDVKESDNQTSQNESDKEKVHLKAVQADLDGLKKEFSEYRKLHKQEEIDKPCADLKSADKIRSKM